MSIFSKNNIPSLKYIHCSNNKLLELNLLYDINLIYLDCSYNDLISLNIEHKDSCGIFDFAIVTETNSALPIMVAQTL